MVVPRRRNGHLTRLNVLPLVQYVLHFDFVYTDRLHQLLRVRKKKKTKRLQIFAPFLVPSIIRC